jgi:hypothetical protein
MKTKPELFLFVFRMIKNFDCHTIVFAIIMTMYLSFCVRKTYINEILEGVDSE